MTDPKTLRALAEKATPGPYYVTVDSYHDGMVLEQRRLMPRGWTDPYNAPAVDDGQPTEDGAQGAADAAYLAALDPSTVLRLLDYAEALERIHTLSSRGVPRNLNVVLDDIHAITLAALQEQP